MSDLSIDMDEYLDSVDYEGDRGITAPEGTDTDFNEDGEEQAHTSDENVQPTLLGDDYTEEQKANDRDLEDTLSEGDSVITGTGLFDAGTVGGVVPEQDTTSIEDASEGYTSSDDVDQTPDRDVYDWQGTVPGEEMDASDAEVSASSSDTAEQDPSLDGSGVVTDGADPPTSSSGSGVVAGRDGGIGLALVGLLVGGVVALLGLAGGDA